MLFGCGLMIMSVIAPEFRPAFSGAVCMTAIKPLLALLAVIFLS